MYSADVASGAPAQRAVGRTGSPSLDERAAKLLAAAMAPQQLGSPAQPERFWALDQSPSASPLTGSHLARVQGIYAQDGAQSLGATAQRGQSGYPTLVRTPPAEGEVGRGVAPPATPTPLLVVPPLTISAPEDSAASVNHARGQRACSIVECSLTTRHMQSTVGSPSWSPRGRVIASMPGSAQEREGGAWTPTDKFATATTATPTGYSGGAATQAELASVSRRARSESAMRIVLHVH
jgi:hypothetical protein